jgi:hypothetical protein
MHGKKRLKMLMYYQRNTDHAERYHFGAGTEEVHAFDIRMSMSSPRSVSAYCCFTD